MADLRVPLPDRLPLSAIKDRSVPLSKFEKAYLRVTSTAVQSMINGTTAMTFNRIDAQLNCTWDGSNVTGLPGGLYMWGASLELSAFTGASQLGTKSAVSVYDYRYADTTSPVSAARMLSLSCVGLARPADLVGISLWQNSGAAVNTVLGANYPSFWIVRIT